MKDKTYPRITVYKRRNLCRHENPDLPWRVRVMKAPRCPGMEEFLSRTAEDCWEHVKYRLASRQPRQRLTKTLRQKI